MTQRPNSKDQIVALIPIRAGSKGLPGKNILPLAGLPLYLHAVHQGRRFSNRTVITTDIDEVLRSELPPKCFVLQRPSRLAQDDTPMMKVVNNVISRLKLNSEILLLLQATSPLRTDGQIKSAIDLYNTGKYDMVMTVCKADSHTAKYGTVRDEVFTPLIDSNYCFANRQSLPDIYRPAGSVYVFSAQDFLRAGRFPAESIGAVIVSPHSAIDIDTAEDFEMVKDRFSQLQR